MLQYVFPAMPRLFGIRHFGQYGIFGYSPRDPQFYTNIGCSCAFARLDLPTSKKRRIVRRGNCSEDRGIGVAGVRSVQRLDKHLHRVYPDQDVYEITAHYRLREVRIFHRITVKHPEGLDPIDLVFASQSLDAGMPLLAGSLGRGLKGGLVSRSYPFRPVAKAITTYSHEQTHAQDIVSNGWATLGPNNRVFSLHWHSRCRDTVLVTLNMAEKKPQWSQPESLDIDSDDEVTDFEVSPSGRLLAVAVTVKTANPHHSRSELRLFHLDPLRALAVYAFPCQYVSFAPDGLTLAMLGRTYEPPLALPTKEALTVIDLDE